MNIYVVYHEFDYETMCCGATETDRCPLCAFNSETEAQAFCKANEHVIIDEYGIEHGRLVYETVPLFNKANEGNVVELNNAHFPNPNYYGHWPETETEIPSSTARDYVPSNPWDAPGMSISDFI